MKIHATLLLAAATVFGSQVAGATTLGLSISLTSLDSSICTGASLDCTETSTDIVPIAISYSRSFESAFDEFSTSEIPLSGGRTAHQSASGLGSNPPLTGSDPDPVFAFLPPVNITAEQFATGTDGVVNEAFFVNAGKVVITQPDGGISRSLVSGDLFESQQWATRLSDGAWVSSQYSVQFSLFSAHVPMTVDDVATPMTFGEFQTRLEQQYFSGGDIPVYLGYVWYDGENSFEEIDSYSGVAHITSLNGLAPVPEAPAPLSMLAGLLVVGVRLFGASAKRRV